MDIDKKRLIGLLKEDDTVVDGDFYPTKLEYDIIVKGGIDEKYRKDKIE